MNDDWPLFVHSKVDDAGLTPAAFRVLCHLFRKLGGKHSNPNLPPGIPSIARTCRLNEDTVKRALKELETRVGLQVVPRSGMTSRFILPTLDSIPEPGDLFGWGEKRGRPKVIGSRGETNGRHPPEEKGDEGNPMKGILKDTPSRPRARDALFDALAAVNGADPAGLTKSAARACGVALAEIRHATPSVTVAEIQQRALNYESHFPGCAITPSALKNHWAACEKPAKPQRQRNDRAYADTDDYSEARIRRGANQRAYANTDDYSNA